MDIEKQLRELPTKTKMYHFRVDDNRVKGLSVRVMPNGSKTYVYRFRFFDTQPLINLGSIYNWNYEQLINQVSLYADMVKQGLDPRQQSPQELNPYFEYKKSQFKTVANLWYEHQSKTKKLNARTLYNYQHVIAMLNKQIGHLPISKINSISLLTACQNIQDENSVNYGLFARRYCRMIFKFAMLYELCENDPTAVLEGQLETTITKNHPAITNEEGFKKLIRDMHDFTRCHPIIYNAINILPYVFVRSNDLNNWRWEDVDFDKKQWVFSPSKKGRAKMVDSLIVPLAQPVIERLHKIQEVTGQTTGLVFPSPRKLHLPAEQRPPIGNSTLLRVFHKMGYQYEQSVHGFRACAKTLLMEKEEFRYDEIPTELQLGHYIKSNYGKAYNRMQDLAVRTRMMDDWAKYLDEIVQSNHGL